ncbi:amino acid permease [Caulobacter segnis]
MKPWPTSCARSATRPSATCSASPPAWPCPRSSMMIYGQTRIFFVMSRDGLLPEVLSRCTRKYKTPHIGTMVTGGIVLVAAAFFPVGKLADISNSGTLFAFLMVAVAVMMMLRVKDPDRRRPFKTRR